MSTHAGAISISSIHWRILLAIATVTLLSLPFSAAASSQNGTYNSLRAKRIHTEKIQSFARVQTTNDTALKKAPLEQKKRCQRTMRVVGVGNACRTRDGLLRVEMDDGTSHTIHGMDAAPVSKANYSAESMRRVNSATKQDIVCADVTAPAYNLIYARPQNVVSRYSTIAPALRSAAYQLSAFIDAETSAVDPSKSLKLPVRCSGVEPIVTEVTIGAVGQIGTEFQRVVQDLTDAGLSFNDRNGNERYLVYTDAPSASTAAGTGHVFTSDTRASAANANNSGGLYAIQYRFANGGDLPVWDIMLHEVMHTMGAVLHNTPNATGIGHCNDGSDIMCYSDGSAASKYSNNVCAVRVLDCNRDDYFHPSPPPGSYLAKNWNVAGVSNRWLSSGQPATVVPDDERNLRGTTVAGVKPTVPARLRVTGRSGKSLGLRWNEAKPRTAVKSYTVTLTPLNAKRRVNGKTRRFVTNSPHIAIGQLKQSHRYRISVNALGDSGLRSANRTIVGMTNRSVDRKAPTQPTNVRLRDDGKRVAFIWKEAKDNVGVSLYRLTQINPTGKSARNNAKRQVALSFKTVATTRGTELTMPLSRLRDESTLKFRLIAVDPSGNTSPPMEFELRAAGKSVAKVIKPALRVAKQEKTAITVAWNKTNPSKPIKGYRAYVSHKNSWVKVHPSLLKRNTTSLRTTNLRAKQRYVFRVDAIGKDGKVQWRATKAAKTR